MPHVEPLPAATLVAIAGLFATVLALWIRPWWVLLAALLVTEARGLRVRHPVRAGGRSGSWVWPRRSGASGAPTAPWQRVLAFVGVAVMAGLLAVHAMSGFQNPVVLRDVVLSSGRDAATRSTSTSTRRSPACSCSRSAGSPRSARLATGRATLRRAAPIVGATIVVVMAASLALGFVRFDPRWTPLFWVWAPINLLLTCVSEEALFRGFLQRELGVRARRACAMRRRSAVAISALAFGLAHAGGGWRYVLLATLAGTGYALAYQRTGRVEASILAHFAVNATHFLLFTYPALA